MTKEECIADLKSINATGMECIDYAIKALEQPTSDDCVSRAELMKLYYEYRPTLATNVYEFGEKLQALSPVTPTRKKARWIKQYTAFVNDDNQIVTECHCTNCYGISYFRSMGEKLVGAKYCPNCGCRMIKE